MTYAIEGRTLTLPLSHQLPLIRRRYPQYGANLARISAHVFARYPSATAIDVGANIGDTAALLRSGGAVGILCVEAHPLYVGLLRANVSTWQPPVDVDQSYVLPAGTTLHGEWHAERGTAYVLPRDSAAAAIPGRSLSELLAVHTSYKEPKLVKLDTDGLDSAILASETALLSRVRPVVFFEYDPHAIRRYYVTPPPVFARLRDAGYRTALFFDNTGDYLLTADLDDHRLLEDLHVLYSGHAGQRYCDVCVFHEADSQLCVEIRIAEIREARHARPE